MDIGEFLWWLLTVVLGGLITFIFQILHSWLIYKYWPQDDVVNMTNIEDLLNARLEVTKTSINKTIQKIDVDNRVGFLSVIFNQDDEDDEEESHYRCPRPDCNFTCSKKTDLEKHWHG